MTYHNPVVGANGQRQAMFLENVQGFGPVLWRNFATSPDDALLTISTSGCNAVTIDVALEAKRLGMVVVALTSLAHAGCSVLARRVGPETARGRGTGAGSNGPRWRFGRLDRRVGDAGRAYFERNRLCDHQPGEGRSGPLAHRGRLVAQGLDRRVPPGGPAPASFSRKRMMTTGAAWECCIGRQRIGHAARLKNRGDFNLSGCT